LTTFEALRIAFKSLGHAVKNAITRPDPEARLVRKARRRLEARYGVFNAQGEKVATERRPSEHKMVIAALRAVMPYESNTQRNAAKRRRKGRRC
jgi:hypothetical protein